MSLRRSAEILENSVLERKESDLRVFYQKSQLSSRARLRKRIQTLGRPEGYAHGKSKV